MTRSLTWTCQRCGAPASTLFVSVNEALERAEALARRDAARFAVEEMRLHVQTAAELLSDPLYVRVPWVVACDGCITPAEIGDSYCGYWIATKRVATIRQVLDWTLHLVGKYWYSATDWENVVRQALGQPSSVRD